MNKVKVFGTTSSYTVKTTSNPSQFWKIDVNSQGVPYVMSKSGVLYRKYGSGWNPDMASGSIPSPMDILDFSIGSSSDQIWIIGKTDKQPYQLNLGSSAWEARGSDKALAIAVGPTDTYIVNS